MRQLDSDHAPSRLRRGAFRRPDRNGGDSHCEADARKYPTGEELWDTKRARLDHAADGDNSDAGNVDRAATKLVAENKDEQGAEESADFV